MTIPHGANIYIKKHWNKWYCKWNSCGYNENINSANREQSVEKLVTFNENNLCYPEIVDLQWTTNGSGESLLSWWLVCSSHLSTTLEILSVLCFGNIRNIIIITSFRNKDFKQREMNILVILLWRLCLLSGDIIYIK